MMGDTRERKNWKSLSLERIYHDFSFFRGAFVHITDELPNLPGTTTQTGWWFGT